MRCSCAPVRGFGEAAECRLHGENPKDAPAASPFLLAGQDSETAVRHPKKAEWRLDRDEDRSHQGDHGDA